MIIDSKAAGGLTQEEMEMVIKDKQTGEVIGEVITNQSLTFDQAMELAGFVWKTLAANGVECDGWYDGDDLYDESSAEMVY